VGKGSGDSGRRKGPETVSGAAAAGGTARALAGEGLGTKRTMRRDMSVMRRFSKPKVTSSCSTALPKIYRIVLHSAASEGLLWWHSSYTAS